MTGPYSIRRAISESYPTAKLVKDILNPPLADFDTCPDTPSVRPRTRSFARNPVSYITQSITSFISSRTKGKLQLNISKQARHSFLAFTAITQVLNASDALGYTAAFIPPEPKTQRESRMRADAQDWVQAEMVEIDTVHGMGTIDYVPIRTVPKGTTLIPTKFTYKCKFGDQGQVIRKKARVCVRGDLQCKHEYTETFAPTSRFNAIRTLMAISTQQNSKLFQFDIRGAFMEAKIDDKDIYIQLPPGYEAPPGMVAKLSRSLYGLRDSAARYHKVMDDWMLNYGFEAIDNDHTMFKFKGEHGTLTVALYVDDRLVASTSDKEYKLFIKALKTRFELSAEDTEVTWYLGVSVKRDTVKGTLQLSQEQYINDMLARFKMEDVNPAITPMEIGTRLTSEDCPDIKDIDKEVVRNYQQIVGSLMYTVAWTHPEI